MTFSEMVSQCNPEAQSTLLEVKNAMQAQLNATQAASDALSSSISSSNRDSITEPVPLPVGGTSSNENPNRDIITEAIPLPVGNSGSSEPPKDRDKITEAIPLPVSYNDNLPIVANGEVISDDEYREIVKKEPVRYYRTVEINGQNVVDDEAPLFAGDNYDFTPENVGKVVQDIMKPEAGYCKSEEDRKQASNEQINNFQNNFNAVSSQSNDEQALEAYRKALEKVDFSKLQKREETTNKIEYKNDSCMIGEKDVSFKRIRTTPDWNHILKENTGVNKSKNLDSIISLITNDLKHQMGGWNRVTTLYVYDSQLIVNGICYMPVVKGVDLSEFPLDTADYIKNGAIAPLFDWKYLALMKNLSTIGFDDATFMMTTVADGLRLGRRMGVTSLFKLLPNLQSLTFGDKTVTREDLTNPKKQHEAVEKLSVTRRKLDLLDGFSLNVYSGTTGFRGYTFNSLKNYATNRGNRGFLRFAGGTVLRGLWAGFGLGVDFVAHAIGGIKNLFAEAMTPVTDEDIQ